jgi:hypothetical protein
VGLEKALGKVGALPHDVWNLRFAEKRDVIRRMTQDATGEDARGETLLLDELL